MMGNGGSLRMEAGISLPVLLSRKMQAEVAGQTAMQMRPTPQCSEANGGVGIKASAFRAEKFDVAGSDPGDNVEFTQHCQRGKSELQRQSSHLPP